MQQVPMRAIVLKAFLFAGMSVFLFPQTLDNDVISVQSIRRDGNIKLLFKVDKGYGIQKDGPHRIIIYKLKKDHSAEPNFEKKVRIYGYDAKSLVDGNKPFTGVTTKEDKDYFSRVDSVSYTNPTIQKDTPFAIAGKIYYCSFSNKFCSVHTIKKVFD